MSWGVIASIVVTGFSCGAAGLYYGARDARRLERERCHRIARDYVKEPLAAGSRRHGERYENNVQVAKQTARNIRDAIGREGS